MKRKLIALTLVLAAAALAACQPGELPSPKPASSPATPPAVLEVGKVEEILKSVRESLTKADAASSADLLKERLGGPAAQMREAEYRLAANSGGQNPVTVLDTKSQLTAIGATDSWPRILTVITEVPTDANLPLLLTLVQDEPRGTYKLWSWVRLFPGTKVPELRNPAAGSLVLDKDATGLAASPKEAVDQYVDVVAKAAASQFAAKFADDPFRAKFHATAQALRQAVNGVGSVAEATAANPMGPLTIATHDGGAIVVGVYDQTLTVKRQTRGSNLTVGPVLAYGKDGAVKGTLTARYMTTVALYVPPAGSDAKIVPLGAEHVLLRVERDDSTSPD